VYTFSSIILIASAFAESGSEIADETDAGVVQYSRSGEYMATGESE